MPLYDNLPLNTRTKVGENDEVEFWATRTENGGTEETVIKPNTDLARAVSIDSKIRQAIATNKTFLALGSPTNAQTLAQVRALTRQMSNMIRHLVGQFDEED